MCMHARSKLCTGHRHSTRCWRAMLTMMATDKHLNGNGFRRQVTFRIGPEEAPLLEAAARVHGGIQAGVLAALRAYAAQRLQASLTEREATEALPSPPRPPADEEKLQRQSARPSQHEGRPPDPAPERTVELNVSEAAPLLGLSAASLREKIKRGGHPGRRGDSGFYLAEISGRTLRESGAELSPAGAAEVLGLRPSTVKARCRGGRYPNARNDGLGWSIPASDIL